MKRVVRAGLSVAAAVTVFLLLYPSVCADSGSAPCDTWIGTRVPELPNAVLIGAVVGIGLAVWALLGLTPPSKRNNSAYAHPISRT